MKEVVNFLSQNPVGYLATIDQEGNPRVRPFQFMIEKKGKLYFCTSNQKDVYQELTHKPVVEFSIANPQFTWIRLFGEVVFSNETEIKAEIIASNSLVKSTYQTPENPVFEIFYLKNASAILADFSGQPPKKFKL